MCRAHAEKAIKVANGQASPHQSLCTVHLPGTLLRTILDCSLTSCQSRMPLWLAHTAEPVQLSHHGTCLGASGCNQPLHVPDQVVGGRTIAVDWAVPKAQFQSASAAHATGALLTLLKRPGKLSQTASRHLYRSCATFRIVTRCFKAGMTSVLLCRQSRRQAASASRSGQRIRDWRRGRHVRC